MKLSWAVPVDGVDVAWLSGTSPPELVVCEFTDGFAIVEFAVTAGSFALLG